MPQETRRQRFDKRLNSLHQERELLMPEWRDLADNFWPRSCPWLLSNATSSSGQQLNVRSRRNTRIINGTPRLAARTLQHGMTAGLCSPARPWFRLRSPDRALNEYGPVKTWCHMVQQVLEDMFARSNFYNTIGVCLGEQGVWGTLALAMYEDEREDLRCWSYPIGSYYIASDARGRVDSFYRRWRPTAREIVHEFGGQGGRPLMPGDRIDWSRISPEVKRAYERSDQTEQRFELVHVVEPNSERAYGMVDARNMPVASCYYECGQKDKGILLRESGFEEMPVMAARWDVLGEDPWGTGPGLDALGDAKQLQYREKQKAKRIDKHNDPPLMGGPELKNKRVSILNGDITYVGFTPNGNAQLAPIHQTNHDTSSLTEDIREIGSRIDSAMFRDLFLMLSMSDQKNVTAEAIARKFEEKVVILGPILERENDELFDPAIDRAFGLALRRGLLPPPPEEMQGQPLKVEYVSLLAQAQRLVSASSIDRYIGMIGGLAKVQADAGETPTIFDKLNFDQAADEYAEALGVPPTIVRSDEDVEGIRSDREDKQRAQQIGAMAQPVAQAAKAAKDLSETDLSGRSALSRIVNPNG